MGQRYDDRVTDSCEVPQDSSGFSSI